MNFRRWVVFTFLVHLLVVAVDKGGGLILYVLTARQADQHGKSGIVASLPFVLMAIANLGLATSLVYYLRKRVYTPQQAFSTTVTVALVWGGIVAGLALVFTLFVLPAMNPAWVFDPWLVVPWCVVVPLLLIASYGNSVQLAVERVRDYGVVHLVTSLAFLPAFFAVFLWLGGSVPDGDVPMAVAWGRLLSTFLVVVLVLWLVRRVVKMRLGIHGPFLRDGLRFGWKANLTSTLTYLNHRIDLIVLGALFVPTVDMIPTVVMPRATDLQDMLLRWTEVVVPLAGPLRDEFFQQSAMLAKVVLSEVAFYGMAVTWAELVWHFPEAMRDLFFSKVAGSTSAEARRLTPILSRLGLAVSFVGGVAVVFLLDPIMGAITVWADKGDAWYETWSDPVGTALVMLTPGTVAFTVSKVLQADLAARGHLQVCVKAQSIVLAVMLTLDFLLMPRYGARGAALASTIAYVASTLYTLWAYSRSTGTATWTCLVVHPSDFRYFKQIVNAVLVKLRWRRP